MIKKTCKIYLDFYDDIKSFYATIINTEPLTLLVPKFNKNLFALADKITVKYVLDDILLTDVIKITAIDDITITADIIASDKKSNDAADTFSIDYKAEISFAIITKEKFSTYTNIAEMINLAERNDLASKLKHSLSDLDIDNEVTLNYLSDINRKLDELLAIARPKIIIPNKLSGYFISLTAKAVTFFTTDDIEGVQNIFLTSTLQDSSDRVTFAAIASLEIVRINEDGSGIYSASFLNLDEDISDAIIRFMFTRERENLKNVAKK